jgi:hypothetical protein
MAGKQKKTGGKKKGNKRTARPGRQRTNTVNDELPLFTLPAELRNKIHEYVFDGVGEVKLPGTRDPTISYFEYLFSRIKPPQSPPLLRTYSQIREEAFGMYYNKTTFTSTLYPQELCKDGNEDRKATRLIRGLQGIGKKNCEAISRLTITFLGEYLTPNDMLELPTAHRFATALIKAGVRETAVATVFGSGTKGKEFDELTFEDIEADDSQMAFNMAVRMELMRLEDPEVVESQEYASRKKMRDFLFEPVPADELAAGEDDEDRDGE